MAGGIGGLPGGILVLLGELTDHRGAINRDLLAAGMSVRDVGTVRLGWDDFRDWLAYSPRTSAYASSRHGEEALWGLTDHLLASLLDAVNIANWQRENAGKRTPGPRPKPVKRPGAKSQEKKFGAGAIRIADFDDWWNSDS